MSKTVSRSSDSAPSPAAATAPPAPSATTTSAPTQLAMGSAPPPPPPPSSGPSIASKLEEQGKMNNLKVTDLRAVKRDNLLRIQVEVTNISSVSYTHLDVYKRQLHNPL